MTTRYVITPQGARFAAQMNLAARVALRWDEERKAFVTAQAGFATAMRRLGAKVVETRSDVAYRPEPADQDAPGWGPASHRRFAKDA